MGDRFYAQQLGKNGYSKNRIYSMGKTDAKPKRRLKADIVKHIEDVLKASMPSLKMMTIADLETLEKVIKK
jgi:hypothetical protein